MRVKTLKDQYVFSYNSLKVVMPLLSAILIIVGVILTITLKEVYYVGLILTVIGGLTILEFIFIRKFLLKKINQLKEN